jgi:hypothetical protein
MNAVEYLVNVMAYSALVLVCVGIPLAAVLELIQWLGPSPFRYLLYPIVAVLFGILVFGSGWFSRMAARRHLEEGAGFVDAMFDTLDEVRLYCALLPGLGRFLKWRETRDTRFDRPPEP